jgi:hypothetical protein
VVTPNNKVALNFLEIANQPFTISFYFKKMIKAEETSAFPNIKSYKLPEDLNDLNSTFVPYFISETPLDGFELVTVSSEVNHFLTIYILFEKLVNKCKEILNEGTDFTIEDGFRKKVNIVISSSLLGNEEIWMEPYITKLSSRKVKV